MTTTTHELLQAPDMTSVTTERESRRAAASALQVVDTPTFMAAGEELKAVAALRRSIEAKCSPAIDAAHKAHKAMLTLRDEHTKPILEIEGVLRKKLGDYQAAEQRRIAEARRLEEERQRQEQERIRAEQERERARLQREAEEKRLAEAAELEQAGKLEQAAAAIEAPVVVEAPAPLAPPPLKPLYVPPAPQMKGVGFTERWSAEVVDIAALVRYAGAHPELGLVVANTATLNALARTQKAALSIPGVKAVSETGTTVR
jgi:hypothetical protein